MDLESAAKAVLFPIVSMAAVVVVLLLLDLAGAGETVEQIVGGVAFFATLTLLHGREWYRGRRAAED